jgi:hypothetical protein
MRIRVVGNTLKVEEKNTNKTVYPIYLSIGLPG